MNQGNQHYNRKNPDHPRYASKAFLKQASKYLVYVTCSQKHKKSALQSRFFGV